jgi:hypothetical protein
VQFLTNVFFIPFLALRAAPEPPEQELRPLPPAGLPSYAPAVGWVAAAVAVTSLVWALAARPEYGGLSERWQYAATHFGSDRVFYAFCVDATLFSFFQAFMLPKSASPLFRYLPFAGLAAWLIAGRQDDGEQGSHSV